MARTHSTVQCEEEIKLRYGEIDDNNVNDNNVKVTSKVQMVLKFIVDGHQFTKVYKNSKDIILY
jgi:hypothetical protein